jgi:hypothetical protein
MTTLFRSMLLAAIVIVPPDGASAQSTQDAVRRFAKFLRSATYETLIAKQAIANDESMAPPCKGERRIAARKLVAITVTPDFIATREVPVKGAWVERIGVVRCGRTVEHNIFVSATKVRGLHAAAGLPGQTRVGLDLQLRAGRVVLQRAVRRNPKCKRFEVINTEVAGATPDPRAPWTEIWTSWICGKQVRTRVRFEPRQSGGADFRVL